VKIRISTHALRAHLRHGDFVVDAANPCPPANTASAKNHKHQGKGKGHESNAAKGKGHEGNATKGKHHQGNATTGKHHGNNKGGKGHGKK
jgi:hypothetical protein